MKNPKKIARKTDGYLSKKDYKKLIGLIDSRLRLADESRELLASDKYSSDLAKYKEGMDILKDIDTLSDLAKYKEGMDILKDIDTQYLIKQSYDDGFHDGTVSTLNELRYAIQDIYSKDQYERNKLYIQGKFNRLFQTFGSIFKFFKMK